MSLLSDRIDSDGTSLKVFQRVLGSLCFPESSDRSRGKSNFSFDQNSFQSRADFDLLGYLNNISQTQCNKYKKPLPVEIKDASSYNSKFNEGTRFEKVGLQIQEVRAKNAELAPRADVIIITVYNWITLLIAVTLRCRYRKADMQFEWQRIQTLRARVRLFPRRSSEISRYQSRSDLKEKLDSRVIARLKGHSNRAQIGEVIILIDILSFNTLQRQKEARHNRARTIHERTHVAISTHVRARAKDLRLYIHVPGQFSTSQVKYTFFRIEDNAPQPFYYRGNSIRSVCHFFYVPFNSFPFYYFITILLLRASCRIIIVYPPGLSRPSDLNCTQDYHALPHQPVGIPRSCRTRGGDIVFNFKNFYSTNENIRNNVSSPMKCYFFPHLDNSNNLLINILRLQAENQLIITFSYTDQKI
ncbi:hypothetical protein PUN28_015410 [Cardiocondyla obscurior]|uniref:Uncharacterized protein n=1 Tax=Cardiocondyla obscurior TaxID=286306 RepID=A0AAW2ESV0_9HYME